MQRPLLILGPCPPCLPTYGVHSRKKLEKHKTPIPTRTVSKIWTPPFYMYSHPIFLIFRWLKNHAPVEKNRRTKIRIRDYWSKLVIQDLDVLDSGYYQCTASNSAGSVNTTSVLRVGISRRSFFASVHVFAILPISISHSNDSCLVYIFITLISIHSFV
jgi:hypothetical protein